MLFGEMNMRNYISLIFISLCLFGLVNNAYADSTKEDVVYKLATLYTQELNPDKMFPGSKITPDDAAISEFSWIIDTLQGKCNNTLDEIANTIISAWKLIKSRGYDMTLLDTARALTANIKKMSKWNQKADFPTTSGFWTSRYKPQR